MIFFFLCHVCVCTCTCMCCNIITNNKISNEPDIQRPNITKIWIFLQFCCVYTTRYFIIFFFSVCLQTQQCSRQRSLCNRIQNRLKSPSFVVRRRRRWFIKMTFVVILHSYWSQERDWLISILRSHGAILISRLKNWSWKVVIHIFIKMIFIKFDLCHSVNCHCFKIWQG